MKIVVTGHSGQVARSLSERASLHKSMDFLSLGRPEFDLSRPETVFDTIHAIRPDLVISAAAYTAVDQAEDEPELAYTVNVSGAKAIAQATAEIGAALIHLSTDYVFAGEGKKAYTENDPTGPRNVYGQTKLKSEEVVAASNPRHFILRTSWVYSPFGKNFVKTMLHLVKNHDSVSVVSDQWGTPTAADDIADGIFCVVDHFQKNRQFDAFGIYHLAGTGNTNWSTFAREIFKISQENHGPFAQVKDILTSEYPTKAARPLNSRLSTEKFYDVFNWRAPRWEKSLLSVVKRIV